MATLDNTKTIREIKTPENRKELYYMWEEQIRDSISKGSTTQQIETLIHIIRQIAPELKTYDPNRFRELEPSYTEVRKRYLKQHPLLIPEMEISLVRDIQRERDREYLRRLQSEVNFLFSELTKLVDWMFLKRTTYGKVT